MSAPSPTIARVGLLAVVAALMVDVAALAVDLVRLRRLRRGGSLDTIGLDFSSTLSGAANILVPLAALAAAGAFLWWFHGCYRRLAAAGLADRPAIWAIVGWLVPGLNLFRPPTIMRELVDKPPTGVSGTGAGAVLVVGWWVLWIEGATIQLVLRFITPTTNLGWSRWQWSALLSDLVLIASITCALALISIVAVRQADLR